MEEMLSSTNQVICVPKTIQLVKNQIMLDMQRYLLHKLQQLCTMAIFFLFLSGVLLSFFLWFVSVFLLSDCYD